MYTSSTKISTFLKTAAVLLVSTTALADSYEKTGDRQAACSIENVLGNQTVRGTGTLVINDFVLTAAHVFESRGQITVKFADERIPARFIAADQSLDLALLKITPPKGIKALQIASRTPEIGTKVEIWGFARRVFMEFDAEITAPYCLDDSETYVLGIIGANEQVTANGDSGGAVVANGELVGVHWGVREREGHAITHATKCETIRQWLAKSL